MILVIIFILGNLAAFAVYRSRSVPSWLDAPLSHKFLRLLWPTAIVVYLHAPPMRKRNPAMTAEQLRQLNQH